ncbi:MAG: hypothetical protein R3C68_17890 [Myxococcota bacterium]
MLDEELQNLRNQTATRPDPGTGSLLASYISGLRHIPLFTPERELENAKHLETLDLQSWRLILQTPRGAYHTHAEATELATDLYRDLGALVESY